MSQNGIKANDPLQMLLAEALAARTPPKRRETTLDKLTLGKISAADKRLREIFVNPENWHMTRHIAVIHKGSDTLLGNFVEYRHNTSKDARKLVRVDAPAPVDAIEYVEANWNAVELVKSEREKEMEEREVVLDVHLKELENVFCPAVILTVRIEWGGIARAELFDDTTFRSKDRRTILQLPAGLDVLEGMSLDCKLELRKAVGL